MSKYSNIVLNIPHSSDNMPVNTWEGNIEEHMFKWTDWKTDTVFEPYNKAKITPVIFPVSRFFCDFERLIDDPLEKEGQGIFYSKYGDCTRQTDTDIFTYAMGLYRVHKAYIASLINKDSLVIDCHSFPEDLAPYTDICIGYNEDWSKPSQDFINEVVNHFLEAGYNVDINNPYSNSITPKDTKDYKSIMIEVNKKNYLFNGTTKLHIKNLMKLNQTINYLYYNILYKWNF